MDAIYKRASAYLEDEMGVAVLEQKVTIGGVTVLNLHRITVLANASGPVNVLMAFCFDAKLLDRVYAVTTAGLNIGDHQRDLFLREAAAETVNCILGHATADLADATTPITLSPPIVLEGNMSVHRPDKAEFATLSMMTSFGTLDTYFIIPSSLLDHQLNVSGREHESAEGSYRR